MSETPIWQPKRREAKASQWGVAAPCSSEQFKTRDSASKPRAVRWHDHFSTETINRTGSSLKGAIKYLQDPHVLSLGGGLPLAEYFPLEHVATTVTTVPGDEGSALGSAVLHAGKHDMAEGRSLLDLSVALNYGQGSGSAQLLRWITEHVELAHQPAYSDWQCTMTIGNTSALDMVLRMFTRSGQCVLADEFTFVAAAETARPMGVAFHGVGMDAQGVVPAQLAAVLAGWDPAAHAGAPKPFLLYLVPTGQNPTGGTQSLERRQAIYRVAQEHNLLIIEDDPYYFLQMDAPSSAPSPVQTPEDLLRSLVPSYLSLDTDGRVVRMDSTSKVVSPGLRLGWLTAPGEIIERYKTHADVSTQSPSGLSQLAVFKLFDEQWGHRGFFVWLLHLRREYTKRRDNALEACRQHLPAAITKWQTPEAGMFIWVEVDWRKHPHAATKSAVEIEEAIWKDVIGEGALVARGSWFFTGQGPCGDVSYRLTFAASSYEKVTEAVRRFGEALRRSFALA